MDLIDRDLFTSQLNNLTRQELAERLARGTYSGVQLDIGRWIYAEKQLDEERELAKQQGRIVRWAMIAACISAFVATAALLISVITLLSGSA